MLWSNFRWPFLLHYSKDQERNEWRKKLWKNMFPFDEYLLHKKTTVASFCIRLFEFFLVQESLEDMKWDDQKHTLA